MRRRFLSLPWEMLDPYPAMVTLTYPGRYWRKLVPDGRALEAHRQAFRKRWERRYEPMTGIWVKEFQRSGAPHLHMFVGLPALSREEMAGLEARTSLAKQLEREHGRYEGRALTPTLGRDYGGEFAKVVRDAWSQVIGTYGRDNNAYGRGVDVRLFYYGRGRSRAVSRIRVAEYLGAEAGKWRQKRPPYGFPSVGRYWGVYGADRGFLPQLDWTEVPPAVAVEVERRLARWVAWKLHARGFGSGRFKLRRPGDGVTAEGMSQEQALRLLRFAYEAAERKHARIDRAIS